MRFENYIAFTVCPFWYTFIFGGTNKVTVVDTNCFHFDSTPLAAIVCAPRLHPTFCTDWARCGSEPGNPDRQAVRWRTAPRFQHRRRSPYPQGWTRPVEPPFPSTYSQPELRWTKQSEISVNRVNDEWKMKTQLTCFRTFSLLAVITSWAPKRA